jgi:hypothetical protein
MGKGMHHRFLKKKRIKDDSRAKKLKNNDGMYLNRTESGTLSFYNFEGSILKDFPNEHRRTLYTPTRHDDPAHDRNSSIRYYGLS